MSDAISGRVPSCVECGAPIHVEADLHICDRCESGRVSGGCASAASPKTGERVHRANACTYWVSHADCLLCDEGHPPTNHKPGGLMRSSKFFWKIDEDGERVHRLQHEWDGNKGAWRTWGTWRSDADNWEINVGTLWSRLGVGIDYDWGHEQRWGKDRTRYSRHSLTVTVGPWYVGWMRCKPVQWHEDGCRVTPGSTCDCDLIQRNRAS